VENGIRTCCLVVEGKNETFFRCEGRFRCERGVRLLFYYGNAIVVLFVIICEIFISFQLL